MSDKNPEKNQIAEFKKEVEALRDYSEEELQNGLAFNEKVRNQLDVLIADLGERLDEGERHQPYDYEMIGQIKNLKKELDAIKFKINPAERELVDGTSYELANSDAIPGTLEMLAKDPNVEVRASVARNENTSAKVLKILFRDIAGHVREEVARNWHTPLYVLEKLAKDHEFYVRWGVGANEKSSLRLLGYLANDSNEYVRWAVACNLNTSGKVLGELAKDESGNVRSGVAGNPHTTIKVLEGMVNDPVVEVRILLATNVTTRKALEILAKDADVGVRYEVVSNNYTPLEVLEKLTGDSNLDVKRMAEKALISLRKR